MGEPHPNLTFDHAAAADAIAHLHAVIKLLKAQTNARTSRAKAMGPPNWTGTHSETFYGTELPRMKKEAATLVSQLQGLITTIGVASQNANEYANENNKWHQTHDPHPSPSPQQPPAPR